MVHKIVKALWGDLHGDELKKFILLAVGFFFLIGPYWILKTLKDSIFINTVGPCWAPYAKVISLIFSLPLVLLYSKLVDIMSKERMVYSLVILYGIIGLGFIYFFYHPTIGIANQELNPARLLGWSFVLYVDSYISLMLALYWSFINDVTTPESAEKGYGLIIFGSQLGGLLFILFGNIFSADTALYTTRAPLLALIAVISLLLIAPLTFYLHKTVNKENLQSYASKANIHADKNQQAGFLDGLKIILTHPYVAGIFCLIFFQELISTVMGYQMMLQAKTTYVDGGLVNKFLFDFGLGVQIIACLFALFGTSFFQRKLGTRFCIVIYPVLLGASILWYLINPNLSTIFYVMLIAKAINLAFNQPAKEVLYIPTSKNIKFKSKVWIDMFGLRFAKAAGSIVNMIISSSLGIVVMSLISVWILLSNTLGNYFQKTINNNELIE